jgi:hypothetical protein
MGHGRLGSIPASYSNSGINFSSRNLTKLPVIYFISVAKIKLDYKVLNQLIGNINFINNTYICITPTFENLNVHCNPYCTTAVA